jgi:SH3-like domain-containing protein
MSARIVIAAAATLVVAAAATAQTATRWVDRTKADVRAGKASFHDVVDTVLKGEQVQVLKTEEKWMNVRTPRGKAGWLFEQALSANAVAPGSDSKFLKNAGGDTATSATAASTGAKGLYAQEYARSKGYDYSVVTWIESNQPTAADIEAFAQAGAGK